MQEEKMDNMDNVDGEGKKSRARVLKSKETVKPESKPKMVLDFKDDEVLFQQLSEVLEVSNRKKYGRKVTILDLLKLLVPKMDEEFIKALKEGTYSKMDKVYLAFEEYNEKHSLNLTLEEYLIRELKIQ